MELILNRYCSDGKYQTENYLKKTDLSFINQTSKNLVFMLYKYTVIVEKTIFTKKLLKINK